ncbi:MAG: hypothetical protein GC185_13895 [Alphaproteobacteria bacterium]|nr:hypothetical protein [Alphaproteobacteria bacterium]
MSIGRRWAGERAFILGTGESLTADAARAIEGLGRVIAVNDAWRLAPFADVLYACDRQWWDHWRGVPEFKGEKWTQDANFGADCALRWGLNLVRSIEAPGLSFDPEFIHRGGNSSYQALNLAAHFGASEIVLLGVDLKGRHFFGDHPQGLRRRSPFAEWRANFATLLPDIARANIKILNASPISELKCFPKVSVDDLLAGRV